MRRFYPETFLIALAVILLEVSYTRVFSYKLVYYFTYLIIGISLLGLGAGGVFVAIFERLRRTPTEKVILISAVGGAIAVLVSYLLVALVPLHLFRMMMSFAHGYVASPLWTLAKLSLVLFVLFLPFLAAGIALSKIFAAHTERIGRLYFADLIGAALGAAIVIPLLSWITPPGTVFLSGFVFALAGARLAREVPGPVGQGGRGRRLGLVGGGARAGDSPRPDSRSGEGRRANGSHVHPLEPGVPRRRGSGLRRPADSSPLSRRHVGVLDVPVGRRRRLSRALRHDGPRAPVPTPRA